MSPGEWFLLVAGSMALGVALAVLGAMAVGRLRRRGGLAGEAGSAGAGDVRHLKRRIRRLNRIARRAQERVQGQVAELRRLLEKAQRLTGGAAPASANASDPDGPAGPAEDPPPAGLQRQRDLVLRLSLQGLEPIDIARRLDMPVGEVELTLKLHQEEKEHARAETGGV